MTLECRQARNMQGERLEEEEEEASLGILCSGAFRFFPQNQILEKKGRRPPPPPPPFFYEPPRFSSLLRNAACARSRACADGARAHSSRTPRVSVCWSFDWERIANAQMHIQARTNVLKGRQTDRYALVHKHVQTQAQNTRCAQTLRDDTPITHLCQHA